MAATNRDLLSMIQAGDFREDLFYRLAVITIKLPPLRERRSDIAMIAATLLAQINSDFAHQEPGYRHKFLSDSAKAFVSRDTWPGNVRELYNVLLQAAVMSDKDEIGADDLTAAIAEMPTGRRSKDDPLEIPNPRPPICSDCILEVQGFPLGRHVLASLAVGVTILTTGGNATAATLPSLRRRSVLLHRSRPSGDRGLPGTVAMLPRPHCRGFLHVERRVAQRARLLGSGWQPESP